MTSGVFERHRFVTGFTIAACIILVTDLGVGSLRYSRPPAPVPAGVPHEQSYRRANPRYHHDLIPLISEDSAQWGPIRYRVRTNSLGFKDAVARQVVADTARPMVLLLGDSFTEGIGVEFEATFAGRLASLGRQVKLDVLNGAVASYAPSIYWRKVVDLLDRRHVGFAEVVVFIDISDVPDETEYFVDSDTNVQSHWPMSVAGPMVPAHPAAEGGWARTVTWLRRHSFALYSAAAIAKTSLGSGRLSATLPASSGTAPHPCVIPVSHSDSYCRSAWAFDTAAMTSFGDAGLANATRHMSALAGDLRRRSIPLTIVVYPWRQLIVERGRRSIASSRWREWAATERVNFLDLFPAFFALADAEGDAAATDSLGIRGDIHWNERGHAFVEKAFLTAYCSASAEPGFGVRPLARVCRTPPVRDAPRVPER
ncbi:MAG: hypothetical protein V4550_15250 [Gemmatimonadota bacterium]